jgi:hypothetical protein
MGTLASTGSDSLGENELELLDKVYELLRTGGEVA